ncbi:C-X-C chemokine receptor type 4-B-like [Lampetra fluviatilis]
MAMESDDLEPFNLNVNLSWLGGLDYEENATAPHDAGCDLSATWLFQRNFLVAAYSAVCLLGLAGNALVAVVLTLRPRSSRGQPTAADRFLLNLAAADLLFVATLPFVAVNATARWRLGTALCRTVHAVHTLNLSCSILLLACIGVDRYRAIVHATTARRDGNRAGAAAAAARGSRACALVWLFSLALTAPDFAFGAVTVDPLSGASRCEHVYPEGQAAAWQAALRAKHLLLAFVAPGAVMLFCYCSIIRRLSRSQVHERRKAVRVTVAIVAVFFVFWLPYNAVVMADTLARLGVGAPGAEQRSQDGTDAGSEAAAARSCALEETLARALAVTEGLGFAHCCLIPVLYAFIGEKFKRRLGRLLKHLRSSRKAGGGSGGGGGGGVHVIARYPASVSAHYQRGRVTSVTSESEFSSC